MTHRRVPGRPSRTAPQGCLPLHRGRPLRPRPAAYTHRPRTHKREANKDTCDRDAWTIQATESYHLKADGHLIPEPEPPAAEPSAPPVDDGDRFARYDTVLASTSPILRQIDQDYARTIPG